MMTHPLVTGFFDTDSNTISYVVQDPASPACAVIDSVLDFDYAAGRTGHRGAEAIIAFIRERGLRLDWLIETHVHADHLSAAPFIQAALGGKIAIGQGITTVQTVFGEIYHHGPEQPRDGRPFDHLFHDGETYAIGSLTATALHTPGHTPACMSHIMGDAAFVGDTLFMPDGGTARADFPGGDAHALYASIQRLYALPPETRLFMCHDYAPNGRAITWQTTVAEQRAGNIHVRDGVSEADFVSLRSARDATLGMPKLMLPAIQVNMLAGHLPAPEANGERYLKIPLNAF